jgi:glycosyltransferase involved in cell wall biosynthesis
VRLLALDLGPGMRGGQRQSALLAAGRAARGHAVRLLARRGSPLSEAARAAGTDTCDVPAGSEVSPALLLAVGREARSFRPDVYAGDARGHGAAVFGRAASGAPLVVHRRVVFPPGRGPLSRLKYRAPARFLAVSGAVADALRAAGVAAQKVAVVPDGLPDDAFRASTAPPPPPFRLVHAGAFDGLKGQEVVVETLARLAKRGLDATALFLGDGPGRPSVEALARARGVADRCTFAGQVEDAGARFAACHLLLLPSASEGAPLVLVEAMAAGCAVVAHDVGGAREVAEGGGAGVLVPSLDPGAWEAAVSGVLLDGERRARLVAAGRAAADARRIGRTIARVEEELLAVMRGVGA